ncbi:hypothetical protein LCGC14_1907560 [marine sediment metagenome]|uniref:Uncharacterized protein n=1 Tax=marine sediment metagenome TaxID=412755 RepID=A0A0F9I8L0_9ZZZZ
MAIDFTKIIPSGSLSGTMGIILWGTLFIAICVVIGLMIRNKVKYIYRARVYKRRQDDFQTNAPASKLVMGKAGYFNVKGRIVFRIKYGMMPWHQIELSKIPDPKYMIDNEVTYIQLQKDNYVQAKMEIDWKGDFNLKPVEDDIKYGAQQDLMEKQMVLQIESKWQKYGGPITLGIILVAGIIALYFQTQACA